MGRSRLSFSYPKPLIDLDQIWYWRSFKKSGREFNWGTSTILTLRKTPIEFPQFSPKISKAYSKLGHTFFTLQ